MTILPIAESEFLEGLIWLVIAFFWVIVQIVSRGKQKGSPRRTPGRPPIPRPSASPLEDELREFLESLGQSPEVEEPPARTAPPPRTAPTGARRPPAARPPAKPAPVARRQAPAATPPPATSDLMETGTQPRPTSFQQAVRESAARLGVSALSSISSRRELKPVGGNALVMVGLEAMRMPDLRLTFAAAKSGPPPPFAEKLVGRENLRRALIGHFILGPPKALDPAEYNTRTGCM